VDGYETGRARLPRKTLGDDTEDLGVDAEAEVVETIAGEVK